MTNCKNCGAPIKIAPTQCEYCGTMYAPLINVYNPFISSPSLPPLPSLPSLPSFPPLSLEQSAGVIRWTKENTLAVSMAACMALVLLRK